MDTYSDAKPHRGTPAKADVSPEEIRESLERILKSGAFRAAPQLGAFLRYVVAAVLDGRGDRIKGYAIATEAFGRGADFDPQTDPIVRVEATRLRRALASYYDEEGKDDPIVLAIPRGSYVPAFERADTENVAPQAGHETQEAAVAPAADRPRWPRRMPLAASLALAAILGAAVVGLVSPSSLGRDAVATIAERSGVPSIAVASFVNDAGDAAFDATAISLHVQLANALSRFDEVAVLDEENGADSDYLLTGRIEGGDETSLFTNLVAQETNEIVWSGVFPLSEGGKGDGDVVRALATAIAQPYGIVAGRAAQASIRQDSHSGGHQCIVEAFEYWRDHDPDKHAAARSCLEQAVQADPGFADGLTALAYFRLDEYRFGLNRRDHSLPLDEALSDARRAVALKPGSARTHQGLCAVHFLRAEVQLALESCERALALNPFDTEIMADYGAHLIVLDAVERGMRMMHQAESLNGAKPTWYDVFLSLGHLLRGETGEALKHAGNIPPDAYSLGQVMRAIAYAEAGEMRTARVAVDRLVAMDPGFAVVPRRILARSFPHPTVVERLVAGLEKAGLPAAHADGDRVSKLH